MFPRNLALIMLRLKSDGTYRVKLLSVIPAALLSPNHVFMATGVSSEPISSRTLDHISSMEFIFVCHSFLSRPKNGDFTAS